MDSVSPSDRYSDVPVTPWAFFPAVTGSSRPAFSSASSVVITFVVEAIGYIVFSFCPNRSRPESASISAAPFAATDSRSDAQAPHMPSASAASAHHARIFRISSLHDTEMPGRSRLTGKARAYICAEGRSLNRFCPVLQYRGAPRRAGARLYGQVKRRTRRARGVMLAQHRL